MEAIAEGQELKVFAAPPGRIVHSAAFHGGTDGRLYLAWYVASRERAKDAKIVLSVYDPDSDQWAEPHTIQNTHQRSDANPVLLECMPGQLELFSAVLFGAEWTDCRLMHSVSKDGGSHWSATEQLSGLEGWMVRNKAVITRGGRIVLPVYDEIKWQSAVYYRDNPRGPWRMSGLMRSDERLIQPTVIERENGELVSWMRSDHDSPFLWESTSFDGGRNWRAAEPTTLPNNNSGTDAVALGDGMVAMAFNDSTGPRTPLSLALSRDEGHSWREVRHVETGPGEFSYPSVTTLPDGRIALAYTYHKEAIRVCFFDPKWLRTNPDRVHEG